MSKLQLLKQLNGGCELMQGRDKGEILKLSNEEIVNIDGLEDFEISDDKGEKETLLVFTIKEDEKNFYYAGSIVKDKLNQARELLAEDLENCLEEGIPVSFKRQKTKNGKKEYTNITFR